MTSPTRDRDAGSADSGADGPLRIGIIGAGNHASGCIYPSLAHLPVRLVAVCDLDDSRARRAARVFGCEAIYTDHVEMLESGTLDAVIVCAGPQAHTPLAIAVMDAGLPVYTEKPPAVTLADAGQMLESSRRTGQICMTAFCRRFSPAYQRAHAAVHSTEFGAPSMISVGWGCPPWYRDEPDEPSTWFLLDFCIHMIDVVLWMFGEVVEVYAHTGRDGGYAVTLAFANGAVGALGFTGRRAAGLTERVDLTGGSGEVIKVEHGCRMTRSRGREILECYDAAVPDANLLVEWGYQGELSEFVAAVQEAREPQSSIESSYETMRLYEAIARSARCRRVVQLGEIDGTLAPERRQRT